MCGIFASFDNGMIDSLHAINKSRGGHSYSILDLFDGKLVRELGSFDNSKLRDNLAYKICHVQAPTTDARTIDSVHPAENHGCYLWHNGIIKSDDVARLQLKQNTTEKWDTRLLLDEFYNEGATALSEIDGSFACIYATPHEIFAFRNEISPLFYDENLNISSVKFKNSNPFEPNLIYIIDVVDRQIMKTNIQFKTKNNPYYIP